MQLFALDEKETLISATSAQKGADYHCLECGGTIRQRRGAHRRPHFFHLSHRPSCKQSGKSQRHLAIQEALFAKIPPGEGAMECPFPAVSRVADVAWLKRGIIFEVQCSYITQEEVDARNRDYLSQGFQVVWILSDRRYNRRRITAAEDYLLGRPCYYTDINDTGRGEFYDQAFLSLGGFRRTLTPRFPIDPGKPLPLKPFPTQSLYYLRRFSLSPFCFAGDLLHLSPPLPAPTPAPPKPHSLHAYLHLAIEWLGGLRQ